MVVSVQCSVGEPRTGVCGCERCAAWESAAPSFGCMNSMAMRVLCGELGSREAAKPRRETQEAVFGVQCSVWRAADGSPRV